MSPKGARIEVRFQYRGHELRPTLPLKPTAANLNAARQIRQDVVDQIKAGTFNLADYFPDYKFAPKHEVPGDVASRTLKDWADIWAGIASRELEHSTLKIYRAHLEHSWLKKFGHLQPRAISHEALLSHLADLSVDRTDPKTGEFRKGISRKTQNNVLIPLRAVFALICKPPSRIPDPTIGINCLRVQTDDPDPFSLEEVEVILTDLRKPRGKMTQAQADELADYYEFAAFAGPRSSEQIALRWTDVDFRKRTVRVQRATVLNKTKERTKTHKARVVEFNNRAWAVIERQRSRTQLAGGLNGLIFRNPFTGRPWVTGEEQRREWAASLRRVGVRYRPPKELRDTSVTVALATGADPYWVARQHGHSIQTMQKDYAGWIPDLDRGRNIAAVNAALDPRGSTVKAA